MPRECDFCGEELSEGSYEGTDKGGLPIHKCSNCGKTSSNDW